MAEQAVVLAVGLDPSGLQRGAQAAADALDKVTDAAGSAAAASDFLSDTSETAGDSVGVLKKELTAAGASAKKFGEEAQKAGGSAASALSKAADGASATGQKIDVLGSLSDVVTRKFLTLGKAAVGMFAADVAAKVFGFRSAMEAIGKASNFAAEKVQNFLGITARNKELEEHRKRLIGILEAYEKITGQLEKLTGRARPETETTLDFPGMRLGYRAPGAPQKYFAGAFAPQSRTFDVAGLEGDFAVRAKDLINSILDRYKSIVQTTVDEQGNVSRTQISDLRNVVQEMSRTGRYRSEAAGGVDVSRIGEYLTESFNAQIEEVAAEIENLKQQSIMAKRAAEMRKVWFDSLIKAAMKAQDQQKELAKEEEAKSKQRRFENRWWETATFPGGFGAAMKDPLAGYAQPKSGESPYANAAAALFSGQRDAVRDAFLAAALEAEQEAENKETAGFAKAAAEWERIAAEAWSSEIEKMQQAVQNAIDADYESQRRSESEAELARIAERARRGEYGVDRNVPGDEGKEFASRIAGGMSSALEAALFTGEWDRFGQSVVNVISQSLINALVTKPFEAAVNAMVQALLAGISRSAFAGAGVSAGASPSPDGMRSMTASTSNAQYRSQRQQFDDSARRRPV